MQKSSSSSSSSSSSRARRSQRRPRAPSKGQTVAARGAGASIRRSVPIILESGRPRLGNTKLNPYFRQLAKQFLTPINAGGAIMVSPNPTPGQVCARHIHKTLDITAADFPNGVSIAMFPNLYQPGFITSEAAKLLPAAGLGPCAIEGSFRLKAPTDSVADQNHLLATAGDVSAAIAMVPFADEAGAIKQGFEITPVAAAQVMDYTVQNVTPAKCTPVFRILTKVAGGNWGVVKDITLAENADASGTCVIPMNSTHIAFTNTSTSGKDVSWKLTLGLPNSCIHAGAGTTLAPAFEEFLLDNDIEYGRVISMSLLATNTSSSLHNGGTINAARVPHKFDPFVNVVPSMAGLPDNRRYQGDAEFGAYCFWLPGQEDEFELDGVSEKRRSLADAEYLFTRLEGWPAGASFRLQFDWVVEFYTPNQLYEKVLTPPMTDQFRQFYYQLLLTPCAMCNPSHSDLLKGLLAKGISTVKSGADFYDQHKALIHGALEMLAAALA